MNRTSRSSGSNVCSRWVGECDSEVLIWFYCGVTADVYGNRFAGLIGSEVDRARGKRPAEVSSIGGIRSRTRHCPISRGGATVIARSRHCEGESFGTAIAFGCSGTSIGGDRQIRIIILNRTCRRSSSNRGGTGWIGERDGKVLIGFYYRVAVDCNGDGFGSLVGGEAHRTRRAAKISDIGGIGSRSCYCPGGCGGSTSIASAGDREREGFGAAVPFRLDGICRRDR